MNFYSFFESIRENDVSLSIEKKLELQSQTF